MRIDVCLSAILATVAIAEGAYVATNHLSVENMIVDQSTEPSFLVTDDNSECKMEKTLSDLEIPFYVNSQEKVTSYLANREAEEQYRLEQEELRKQEEAIRAEKQKELLEMLEQQKEQQQQQGTLFPGGPTIWDGNTGYIGDQTPVKPSTGDGYWHEEESVGTPSEPSKSDEKTEEQGSTEQTPEEEKKPKGEYLGQFNVSVQCSCYDCFSKEDWAPVEYMYNTALVHPDYASAGQYLEFVGELETTLSVMDGSKHLDGRNIIVFMNDHDRVQEYLNKSLYPKVYRKTSW